MLPRIVYLLVVVIWSTTPLAIKFSGTLIDPFASMTIRIVLAFLLGCVAFLVLGSARLNIANNWRVYLAASLGVCPTMVLVYMSAEYISSGLIALLFGMSPFTTALLSPLILGENILSLRKGIAIVIAFIGLLIIVLDQLSVGRGALNGIGLMVLSSFSFSISALWVVRFDRDSNVSPVEKTLGSMAFSIPGLCLSWLLFGDFQLASVDQKGLWSLLYLATVGSLLGFVAYFYLLKHIEIAAVSIIPLITPVFAIAVGLVVAGERASMLMALGMVCVVSALALYQNIYRQLAVYFRA